MPNTLVPELAVSDWERSCHFYVTVLGFSVAYDRPEDGFSYLTLGDVELMIDQIGLGRDFDDGHLPREYPFGRGVNLQIRVDDIDALARRVAEHGHAFYLPLENRWYRKGDIETGNRQFVVPDPDGYLLRFYQDLGERVA